MAQKLTLTKGNAPHLKNEISFVPMLSRELGAMLILFFSAIWVGGAATAILFLITLLTVIVSDAFLHFLGFSARPRWDIALIQQGVLLVLFIPNQTALELIVLAAFTMTFFYRISGGRGAYVLHPACLALAFLSSLGTTPIYALEAMTFIPSIIVFAIWVTIRLPKTKIEWERLICVLFLAFILMMLHSYSFAQSLLWSAAAGEIIFGAALAPQVASARRIYRILMVVLFAAFASSVTRETAMMLVGLSAGFFAAWIEQRALSGKSYESNH